MLLYGSFRQGVLKCIRILGLPGFRRGSRKNDSPEKRLFGALGHSIGDTADDRSSCTLADMNATEAAELLRRASRFCRGVDLLSARPPTGHS